jgi:uncharacterized protein YacL
LSRGRTTTYFIEFIRLAVVTAATAGAHELSSGSQLLRSTFEGAAENWVLLVVVLGAGIGYVVGGAFGRFAIGRVDAAERKLRSVSSAELVAAVIGGLAGLVIGFGLAWPLLLFESRMLTLPLAGLVVSCTVAIGVRVGVGRGGDLLRAVGASGRITVTTPASGPGVRVVDTSALVDGRLLHVCRSGFVDGTLVIPQFVLYELQGLADAADEERRMRGRRGLDVLAALQRAGVSVEVTDRDYPDVDAVDAKLVAMARDRRVPIVTVDGNLARVAEIQGLRVLNLHQLAEDLRPPVLPGDEVEVRVLRPGKEEAQGVGYLADGTMVVVEGARDHQGTEVKAEVTSILTNPNGRMVFATLCPAPTRIRSRAAAVE